MKIKVLPFDEAVKKAKEQGGMLAEFTDNNQIIGANRITWKRLENKVLDVYSKNDFYCGTLFDFTTCTFGIPKCCCEVLNND